MKQLAFVGHLKRGKEIKEILQQLGGTHVGYACSGERFYFYINRSNTIEGSSQLPPPYDVWKVYTLEEFEKEFPYKVGDVVTYVNHNNASIDVFVHGIRWNPHRGAIEYILQTGAVAFAENLKPMKKELKDYLKPGYVVEHTNGVKFVITQDVHGNNFGLQLEKANLWSSLTDLTLIDKVYQINKPGDLHEICIQEHYLTLVWERPKEVELTMQQIADKFGIDVKNLRIKK